MAEKITRAKIHVHQASQCHVSAEDLSHLAYSNVNEQRIKQQQRKATRSGNFKLQIVNILWNICVSSQAQSESWRDNNKKVIEAIIAPYRSLSVREYITKEAWNLIFKAHFLEGFKLIHFSCKFQGKNKRNSMKTRANSWSNFTRATKRNIIESPLTSVWQFLKSSWWECLCEGSKYSSCAEFLFPFCQKKRLKTLIYTLLIFTRTHTHTLFANRLWPKTYFFVQFFLHVFLIVVLIGGS